MTVQLDKQAEAGPKEALPGVRLSDCFPCTKCWPQPYARTQWQWSQQQLWNRMFLLVSKMEFSMNLSPQHR